MTYDRRYPMMDPFCHVRYAGRDRTAAMEIARRTGTTPFLNVDSQAVLFVYGIEPHGGPLMLSRSDLQRYGSHDIDRAVEYIQLGRMTRREKDRIGQKNEAERKYEAEQEKQKFLAERRPDAKSYARYLDEKRRGTTKKTVAL